ncbi:alpha/beta fold hydrolase [Streptomyces sp. NPDC013178]|uniref:thioesterase II family protein n=1 Tax=Streptomyces sp. NPDC013178 TaxID=3155118 RepID=UPI0033BFD386
MRLYCFHSAGAGTLSFAPWPRLLGPSVEVVPVLLPGRDTRVREARVTDLTGLHRELHGAIDTRPGDPYALYGHSLGGLVAHHLAVTWHRFAETPPRLLVVGAALPPHVPLPLLDTDEPTERQLLELLSHSGALSLSRDVLYRYLLPLLRDDLALARALRRAANRPAGVPLLAVSGARDTLADARRMAGWDRWTTAGFTARTVPGDHFFVREPALTGLLTDVLGSTTTGPATEPTTA